jgi:hypothetical protein
MEASGRDKIVPSQSLRKVLNPLQEGVMKSPRFRTLTQKVTKWLPRMSSHFEAQEGIDKNLVDDWKILKGKLKH